MSDWIEAGQKAPDFTLLADNGDKIKLSALKGQPVVLYFYPRDDTPGCTKEACDFRDNFGALRAAGAVVLGLSPDTAATHSKFAAKYDLPFQLLVDEAGHAIARAYGAWEMKKNYGKEYEGMIRSTVIIAPDGTVAKSWGRVKPDAHGQEVLAWLTANAAR